MLSSVVELLELCIFEVHMICSKWSALVFKKMIYSNGQRRLTAVDYKAECNSTSCNACLWTHYIYIALTTTTTTTTTT